MQRLIVFNHVSLDGFFVDARGEMSWAHKSDPEWDEYSSKNASGGGTMVFGRKTYEMMVAFWPTQAAAKALPIVARQMNAMPKLVFSRTLEAVSWNNTRLVKTSPAAEIRRLKSEPGNGMAILGSGSIVAQLAAEGLVDEFTVVVNPLVLGSGRTMFEGLTKTLALKLTGSREFRNGNVVLTYEPAR